MQSFTSMKKIRTKTKEISSVEICNHFGKSVSFGLGLFVNRVPDLNDISTRIDNGLEYPLGDFVCRACDKLTTEF